MTAFLQSKVAHGPSSGCADRKARWRPPDTTWTHSALPTILGAVPLDCESLVDLGCGRGIMGALCRIYRAPRRLVGIDGFEPYLAFCREAHLYDELIQIDLGVSHLPFQTGEFHVASCIEVIEHLPKEQGCLLLDELERVASYVILTTPGIWFEQDDYDGNSFQRHLSLWTARDFIARGYRVHGVGALNLGYQCRQALRSVFGARGVSAVQNEIGGAVRRVSELLGPLTYSFPRLSTKLLCVKITDSRSAARPG